MRAMADLITPAYLAQQKWLHAQPRGYGGRGDRWAETVRGLIARFDARSVLDYGCGQGTLGAALRQTTEGVRISEYDPAIPGKDGEAPSADLVVCTDVLEHIEPDRLTWVLEQLKSLARTAVFVAIATRPASKTLPDGTNAHLTVENGAWWQAQVEAVGFTAHPLPSKPSREWVAVLTC